MRKNILILVIIVILFNFINQDLISKEFKMDEFKTEKGYIKIYFIGHGTLVFDYNGTVIHVDPVKDYIQDGNLPKADIILITHHHKDHFDSDMITKFSKENTIIICTQSVFDNLKKGTVLKNGESWSNKEIKVEAVPAYNTTEGRDRFHPKGRDNGYVLTLGNKRIYIAGDTEDIPEMSNLKNIDIAFLPMNQPYTMTPQQIAKSVEMIKPKVLYPYHFGDTNVEVLVELLKNKKDVELRIRELK